MKKFLLLSVAVLLLLLCFVSCGGSKEPGTTTPGTTTPPVTTEDSNTVTVTFNVAGTTETVVLEKGTVPSYTGSTIKLSDDTFTYRFTGWDKEFVAATEDVTYTAQYDIVPLVTYTVRWIFADGDATTTVKENDVPVPPAFDATINTDKFIYTFVGWSSEFLPLTQDRAANLANLMIVAKYDTSDRLYTVKFMVDGAEYATTETKYGDTPVLPATVPAKTGYSSMYWLNSDTPVLNGSHVCEAIFALTDAEQLGWALTNETMFGYSPVESTWDNDPPVQTGGNAVLYLLYELRRSTTDHYAYDAILSRILEHLRYMIDPKNDAAPLFDLRANWPYCTITSAILLAKETPAVWNELTADEKERYDFIMECFAYILTLGTDDDNEYKTGPLLQGNYYKGWNPNYRLATCLPMIFVGRYFGGAAKLDELLLAFDFDTVVEKFTQYNFMRAYNCWTTVPAQKADGSYYPSARDFMMNGGDAFVNTYNERLNYEPGTPAGTGVGVRTTYTYKGYTVDQPEKIIETIFAYCYEGGMVKSSYGVDSDGKPLAYIVDYLTSPYEGEMGLMKEFAGTDANGIRSSTDYCEHDFLLVVATLLTVTELDMYDPLEADNLTLFRLVWVGNQDFTFKFEKGYMSYSLGESKGVGQESTKRGYMLMKSVWNLEYGSMTLSDFPAYSGPIDPNSSDRYMVNGATVQRVTASSHWDEKQGSTYAEILMGDHFYPTEANPNGKSLFIEFSFLYNETLAKLDYPGLALGKIGGLTPYYLALTSNFYDLWCKTAGGFESTGGTTVVEGPNCNKGNGVYPNIGEYGWHRIGLEIHQDTAIVSGKVEYTLYVSLYVDGVLLSKIQVPNNTITGGKPGADYLLYTATISDNKLVYRDNTNVYNEIYAYRCEGCQTKGSNVAYIVTKNMSIRCGTDFILNVSPADSPVSDTLEVDPGVLLNATSYFTVNTSTAQ